MEWRNKQMSNKTKNMLSAVLFWAWGEGMEADANQVSSDILIAKKGEHKIAFIAEFDRTREELLEVISKSESDFVYVVTDDNGKRRELLTGIPDYCGILCYGNPFGLGFLYMVLKEPKQTKR